MKAALVVALALAPRVAAASPSGPPCAACIRWEVTGAQAARLLQGGAGLAGLHLVLAATAITLAALSNTVVKAGMVVSLGGPALRRPVLLASAGLIAVGIATVVAMRWWWGA